MMAKEIYQMPTKTSGRGNKFEKGITGQEKYGTNRFHNTGVPQTGYKGELREGQGMRLGVPIPGQGKITPRVKPTNCSATTKKGEPCKAAPVKGEGLCVGHMRASGS